MIKQIKDDQIYQKGIAEGMHRMAEVVFYMTAYTLDYKMSEFNKQFTDDELVTLMYYICNNIDSFRTGQLSSQDFIDIKKEMNEKGIYMK